MKSIAFAALVSLPLAASAQHTAEFPSVPNISSSLVALDSSAPSLPEAPAPRGVGAAYFQAEPTVLRNTRPFSALAIAAKIGVAGIGFDVATPLSSRFNLRAGASFFGYQTNFTADSIPVDGNLKLRNVAASLDWYPFHNSFRISPGITLYNDNNIAATILVPGGQTITLNDTDYTSDPANPIHGNAALKFGNKVAPRITAGFGNMIPRSGKHWSFPFEIGFQYIAEPTVALNLTGGACSMDGCGSIDTDPETQANIAAQRQILTNDVAPLRFFPVLSTGVGYRFGR